ncbi:MAG: sulfotransferase family 2 domain-containing protein [Pseudomonadota bacterium]
MIVSKTNNFIFVHIPKNAGTTIETLLLKHLNPESDMHFSPRAQIPDNRALFGIPPETTIDKHVTTPRLRAAMRKADFDSYFSFSFSRNPYSRCYSCYKFLIAAANRDIAIKERGKVLPPHLEKHRISRAKVLDMSFDDICADLPTSAMSYGLMRTQTTWLPQPNSVNFVGSLENLSQDLHHIYRTVGLPLESLATIPRENVKTTTGGWRGMSAASAQAIRKFYAEDFERFGYSTDFDADDKPAAKAPTPN